MTTDAIVRPLPIRLLSAALLLVVLGGAQPTNAQTTLASSPALACLTRTANATALPAYPAYELSSRESGTVRVQLEFTAPDAAPKVTILSRPIMGQFDDSVSAHVKHYRVPCMRPDDGPVKLTQDYVFDPDQQSRVVASPPRDTADPLRAAQLKCMAHITGAARPDFPNEAMQAGEDGSLVMRLRFTSPTAPPAVEVVSTVPSRRLRRAVAEHLAGMRVPCLQDQPLETLITFHYQFQGGARTVLRDASLIEALKAARQLSTPVHFDFKTMHCPFELRIVYHRPFGPNDVQQLDTAVPAREPFMEWLRGLTLNLPDETAAKVFGTSFVVKVPCTTLTL